MSEETTPPVTADDDEQAHELINALAYMLRVIGDDNYWIEGPLNEEHLRAQPGAGGPGESEEVELAYKQLEAHTARLPMDTDIPAVARHMAAFYFARDMLRENFVALAALVAPPGWEDKAVSHGLLP